MDYRKFQNKYVIRVDKGEEIVDKIKQICRENNIKLGWVKGLGAVNKITLGLFETSTKKYIASNFEGDYEISALYGNISTMNGEVYTHIHASISDSQCKTFGGHLSEAVVSATAEIVIESMEGTVEREFNEEIGLNLYKFL